MLHELYLGKYRFFVSKLDRQPMGFEPMSLWLYTLSILMGGGNAIWVQAHRLQVFNMPVLFQRYMYLFIWEELCVCYIVFLIDSSSEISGLKILGIVDLKAVGESWKNKQESQRRPVEAGQESSDG